MDLVRSPRGWVLIDWDTTAPGSGLWELAYAAQTMGGLRPDRPVGLTAERLALLVDGYGLPSEDRPALAGLLGRRARAMYDLLRRGAERGEQPWTGPWPEDGRYWQTTADHLDQHVDHWTRALVH